MDEAGKLKNVLCCPRCWTDSMGATVLLEYDPRTRVYVCKNNRMHRFTSDENGFLTSANK